MSPKPFTPLNHFTVPRAMYKLLAGGSPHHAGPGRRSDDRGGRRPCDAVPPPSTVPAGVQDTNTETERPTDLNDSAGRFVPPGAVPAGGVGERSPRGRSRGG